MKAFFVLLALLVFSAGASADMYPDASNAKLPDARANLAAAPHVPTNAALMAAATTAFPSGVWRDTFGNGNNAPPLWYTPSSSPCSFNSGDGDNGSQVKSGDGKCWLAVFPATGYDVAQFGASPGALDNTAPINAAIKAACAISATTAGNAAVVIGPAIYNVAGTLGPLNCNGVSLIGQAPFSAGITCTSPSTSDCIQVGTFPTNPSANCTGATTPPTCLMSLGNRVANLSIDARGRTGGYAISLNGAANPVIDNLIINSWNAFNITYVGHANISNVIDYVYSNSASDYAINVYNLVTSGTANWYKVDVLSFTNVVVRVMNPGATNCMLVDGAIETLYLKFTGLLSCLDGLDVKNTQQQTIEGYFPVFLVVHDLEVDGAWQNALNISGGKNMMFAQSNFNTNHAPVTCGSCQVIRISGDNGYSETGTIWFSDSDIHNGPVAAAYIQGRDISFNNVKMHDLCWPVAGNPCSGSDSFVQIFGPASAGIKITNSVMAPLIGDFHPTNAINGVYINSGVVNVVIDNDDFRGTTTAGISVTSNVFNASAFPVSFIGGMGFNNVPITAGSCALSREPPGPGVGTRC